MLDVLDRIQDPRSVIIIHVGVRRGLLGLLLRGVGLRTTLVGRCLELVLGWDREGPVPVLVSLGLGVHQGVGCRAHQLLRSAHVVKVYVPNVIMLGHMPR